MNVRNHVQLIGRFGMKPEVTQLDGGRRVANIQMATSHYYTASNGEKKEETEWHRVVAYGKFAETLEQRTDKGSEVMIHGTLRTRKWTDKSGTDHWTTEIIVSHLFLMSNCKTPAESNG